MYPKPSADQHFRCKTLNCVKSFKSASSLFRHNKCCANFVKGAAIGAYSVGERQVYFGDTIRDSGAVAAAGDIGDEADSFSSDGEIKTREIEDKGSRIRDAACVCEPEDGHTQAVVSVDERAESDTTRSADRAYLQDPEELTGKNKKKQVILNPAGEHSPEECFLFEDLFIDENQATKLESYSCYAGVPQRDKAGQFCVWVKSPVGLGPELHRVSRHARLYSQLLGRISSATKKMDSKIVHLANSILEKGHSQKSFDFQGLICWSFIVKLYAVKSSEAKKLIQSFSGSASNRMRVIVGLCNASRVGKMRQKYCTSTPPLWISQLNNLLQTAILSDLGGSHSIRNQFYLQVENWDGKDVTEELIESMLFLRLLYLFHELGYFKASQVNRKSVEGGGDSVKWMSYFDEIEALCAVQAAFSSDFTFVLSKNAEQQAHQMDEPDASTSSSSSSSSSSSPTPCSNLVGIASSQLNTMSNDINTDSGDSHINSQNNLVSFVSNIINNDNDNNNNNIIIDDVNASTSVAISHTDDDNNFDNNYNNDDNDNNININNNNNNNINIDDINNIYKNCNEINNDNSDDNISMNCNKNDNVSDNDQNRIYSNNNSHDADYSHFDLYTTNIRNHEIGIGNGNGNGSVNVNGGVNGHENRNEYEIENHDLKIKSKTKKNIDSPWSAHVRAMCKMCGASVKKDKDRVCSDAWTSAEGTMELSDENKELAEKIIRLRNYAFLSWQIFDSPEDRRNLNFMQIGNCNGLNRNFNSTFSSSSLLSFPSLNKINQPSISYVDKKYCGTLLSSLSPSSYTLSSPLLSQLQSQSPLSESVVASSSLLINDDIPQDTTSPKFALKSQFSTNNCDQVIMTEMPSNCIIEKMFSKVPITVPTVISLSVPVEKHRKNLKRLNSFQNNVTLSMKKGKDIKLSKKFINDEDDATFY